VTDVTDKEWITVWIPIEFKLAVRNVGKRTGRTISAVVRDALFGDPDLLDEYLDLIPAGTQTPGRAAPAARQ